MTEAEWLTCGSPDFLLRHLKVIGATRASRGQRRRKLRLLGCAACRQIEHLLRDTHGRQAIRLAERYADGAADASALKRLADELSEAKSDTTTPEGTAEYVARILVTPNDRIAAELALNNSLWALEREAKPVKPSLFRRTLRTVQSALVRDIFGNPFRRVSVDPRWQTSDVLGLARGIYEERAFDRMPILADALMDAGCDSDNILSHCRNPGPHVRGCWVVDVVLGKR